MPRLISNYIWDKVILELRSERYLNCTQESLARKLQASVFSISKWERGTVPGVKYRNKLRRVAEQKGYSPANWPTHSQTISIVKKLKQ